MAEKLIFLITHGPDNPERVTIPFTMATKAIMFYKLTLLIAGLVLISLAACSKAPSLTSTPPATIPTSVISPTTTQPTAIPTSVISPTTTQPAPIPTSVISPTTTQPTAIPTSTASSTATVVPTPIQTPASGVKQAGDLRVWIVNSPHPAKTGNNTLDTYIIDSNGQPVSDAVLTYDINMTNMNMGRSILRPSLVGDGHYSRAVFFSMGGPWRVIITIVRSGQTNTTSFDFTVNY